MYYSDQHLFNCLILKYIYIFQFQCRDTYYIESFHNAMLIYVPKIIRFGDDVYNMRVNFASLDCPGYVILMHFTLIQNNKTNEQFTDSYILILCRKPKHQEA